MTESTKKGLRIIEHMLKVDKIAEQAAAMSERPPSGVISAMNEFVGAKLCDDYDKLWLNGDLDAPRRIRHAIATHKRKRR